MRWWERTYGRAKRFRVRQVIGIVQTVVGERFFGTHGAWSSSYALVCLQLHLRVFGALEVLPEPSQIPLRAGLIGPMNLAPVLKLWEQFPRLL